MIKSVLLTCAFSFLTALNVPLKTIDQFKADEEVLEKAQKKELYYNDFGYQNYSDLDISLNYDDEYPLYFVNRSYYHQHSNDIYTYFQENGINVVRMLMIIRTIYKIQRIFIIII